MSGRLAALYIESMRSGEALLWIKALLVCGYAIYLTLFVVNNVSDPITNSGAIEPMMSMRALKADQVLGRGVVWRAIDSPAAHRAAYRAVIAGQGIAAVLLWRAAALLTAAGVRGYERDEVRHAVGSANLGLLAFLALAFGFVLGSLWFVSWVKMGPVAQAHTTLLFVALFGVIVVNLGV